MMESSMACVVPGKDQSAAADAIGMNNVISRRACAACVAADAS